MSEKIPGKNASGAHGVRIRTFGASGQPISAKSDWNDKLKGILDMVENECTEEARERFYELVDLAAAKMRNAGPLVAKDFVARMVLLTGGEILR